MYESHRYYGEGKKPDTNEHTWYDSMHTHFKQARVLEIRTAVILVGL